MSFVWLQAHTNMIGSKIKNKDSVLIFGHLAHAFSAILGPISSSVLVKFGVPWRYLYFIVIFLIILDVILFVIFKSDIDKTALNKNDVIPLKDLFKYKKTNIYFLLTLVANFFYVLTEAIITSWAPTFFRLYRFYNVQSAGLILTFLWAGIIVGRAFLGILTRKFRTGNILLGLSAISFVSLIIVTFSKMEIVSFIAIFCTGLGFSGIVPLLISSATAMFTKGKAVIISIFFIIPMISFSLGPILSILLSRINIILSLGVTAIFMLATITIVILRMLYRANIIKQ